MVKGEVMDSVLKHIDNAIEVKDFVKAAALVNDLRKEHESDIRVILKWTNLALFLKQFDKAFLYVESQYNKDRSMLEKALLADCASVAQYFMMNLDIALLWSHRTILHLTQLAERNEIPKPPEQGVKKFMGFEEGIVDSIIWPVLVKLHQQNIPATLFEGSLLAITREGKFFSYDKDVDLMVWQESFNELCVWLQNNGWKRASNLLPFDNFAAFVHNEMDLTLDVMGLKRMPENHNVLGGFWLYSHSRDFQLLTSYPYFKLETKKYTVW